MRAQRVLELKLPGRARIKCALHAHGAIKEGEEQRDLLPALPRIGNVTCPLGEQKVLQERAL